MCVDCALVLEERIYFATAAPTSLPLPQCYQSHCNRRCRCRRHRSRHNSPPTPYPHLAAAATPLTPETLAAVDVGNAAAAVHGGKKAKNEAECYELLIELSERGLFPRNVAFRSISKCQEIRNILRQQQQRDLPPTMKKYSPFEIAALALYLTLIEHEITRTPLEVSQFFQVRVRKVWELEKRTAGLLMTSLPARSSCSTVMEYIERFVGLLNLPYSHCSKIKDLCLQLYGYGGMSPQCLAASVIYLYCCNMTTAKEENQQQQDLKLSLRHIGETCHLSTENIRRNIRKRGLENRVREIMMKEGSSSSSSSIEKE